MFQEGQRVRINENAFPGSDLAEDVGIRGKEGEVGECVDSGDPNDPGYWVWIDYALVFGAYLLQSELTAISE